MITTFFKSNTYFETFLNGKVETCFQIDKLENKPKYRFMKIKSKQINSLIQK